MLSVPVNPMPDGSLCLHASTVCLNDKALVIAGPSGSGKSTLALRMISLGADLVADDTTHLRGTPDHVTAHHPATMPPLIEVRGVGLLHAPHVTDQPVHGILDLGTEEIERLPDLHHIELLGRDVTLLRKPATPYIAEAMIHYLRFGRST